MIPAPVELSQTFCDEELKNKAKKKKEGSDVSQGQRTQKQPSVQLFVLFDMFFCT